MDLGVYGLSMTVVFVLVVVYAFVLILLPFFVFRIRNEIIELNRINRRLLQLLEAVVPDSKKPKPAPKPKEVLIDGQMMRVCPKCGTNNYLQDRKCKSCNAQLIAY